ncbi:hypothetical protein [Microbacterium testaceum]|uniref:hypothetical protein n=1 Tax=Microbacterium testaceum TaxID=2033 RepID=UPI0012ACC51D|nr:hypothetical protein [Microbacterium testaceum]
MLDTSALAKRQRKAEEDKRARAAAEVTRQQVAVRAQNEAALEQERRAAVASKYPSATDDPGEYDLERAAVTARIGALAVIQAASDSSGVIRVGSYGEADIAPTADHASSARASFAAASALVTTRRAFATEASCFRFSSSARAAASAVRSDITMPRVTPQSAQPTVGSHRPSECHRTPR